MNIFLSINFNICLPRTYLLVDNENTKKKSHLEIRLLMGYVYVTVDE